MRFLYPLLLGLAASLCNPSVLAQPSLPAPDAVRMDRLIGDISDSSRVDAELSRTISTPVDIAPILSALSDLHAATRDDDDPVVLLEGSFMPHSNL